MWLTHSPGVQCPDDSSSVPVGMYQWMERVAAMSTARKVPLLPMFPMSPCPHVPHVPMFPMFPCSPCSPNPHVPHVPHILMFPMFPMFPISSCSPCSPYPHIPHVPHILMFPMFPCSPYPHVPHVPMFPTFPTFPILPHLYSIVPHCFLQPGDDPQYFYAVVAVFPSGLSNSCSSVSVASQSISTESSAASSKNVTLELLESLSEFAYTMGVLVPTVVFMSSYIIALVWIVVFDWIRLEYSLLLRGGVVNHFFFHADTSKVQFIC